MNELLQDLSQMLLSIALLCFGIREILRHGRLEDPRFGLSLQGYLGREIARLTFPPRWFGLLIKGAVPDLLIPTVLGLFAAFLGHVGLASALLTWSGAGKIADQLSTHIAPTLIRRWRGLRPSNSPGLENWAWYLGLGGAELGLIRLMGGNIVWPLALISAGIFILLWVVVFGLWAANTLRRKRRAFP